MILTREAWLQNAIDAFRPWFGQADAPLPDEVRVSVGWPVGSRKAIGQCWFEDVSADKLRHIFISPVLIEAPVVLATLLHECAHAALPIKTGHRAPFAKLSSELGLVKPWTATTAGETLAPRLRELGESLGTYPHGQLSRKLKLGRKNPYHKVACGECGLIVYITPKMIDEHGLSHGCPSCGNHGFGGATDEDPTGD